MHKQPFCGYRMAACTRPAGRHAHGGGSIACGLPAGGVGGGQQVLLAARDTTHTGRGDERWGGPPTHLL